MTGMIETVEGSGDRYSIIGSLQPVIISGSRDLPIRIGVIHRDVSD